MWVARWGYIKGGRYERLCTWTAVTAPRPRDFTKTRDPTFGDVDCQGAAAGTQVGSGTPWTGGEVKWMGRDKVRGRSISQKNPYAKYIFQ